MAYYYTFPIYHIIWISFVVLFAIIICIVRARRAARYASATQPQTVVIPIEPAVAMQPYPPIQHQQPYYPTTPGPGYGAPVAGPPPGSYPPITDPMHQYQQQYQQQQPYPPLQTYPQSPYQPQQQLYAEQQPQQQQPYPPMPMQPYPPMQPSPAVATASVSSPVPASSSGAPGPSQADNSLFSPPPVYSPANPALQPAPPVETTAAASSSTYPAVYGAQAGQYGQGTAEGQKAKEQNAFFEDKSQGHSHAPRGPQGQGSL